MKIHELLNKISSDKVAVQVLNTSIVGAVQKKGFVEVKIGTEMVSMQEIATGKFDNVNFLVSVPRAEFDRVVAESKT